MKKICLFAAIMAFILTACSKDDPATDNTARPTVRFDFSATRAGNYSIQAITDTSVYTETISTATWSRTLTANRGSDGSDSAQLTVFPPVDWVGTTNVADVTVKIFVNDVEKGSSTAQFLGTDRPNGVSVKVAY